MIQMFIKILQILHWLFLDGRKRATMKMLEHRSEREERHRKEERLKR